MPEKSHIDFDQLQARPALEADEEQKNDVIEARYDELLAEREELKRQQGQYEPQLLNAAFLPDITTDASMRDLTAEWLERVRKNTALLAGLDRLGIEIFKEDLTQQNKFPGEKISFQSEKLRLQNVRDADTTEGIAQSNRPDIQLLWIQPALREQVGYFFHHGHADGATNTLIHELIHRYHFRLKPDTSRILTEAQAYFSGILGDDFTLFDTAQTLTDPEGTYGFNPKKVHQALRAIVELYALGKGDDEIGKQVAHAQFDPKLDNFVPLSAVVDRLKKKYHLDDLDTQALTDIYRLHAHNQRERARLELYRLIDLRFDKEKLREQKRAVMRQSIGFPLDYKYQGVTVSADKFLQGIVCPANERFPYDPIGERTGIIFGLFPKKDRGDKPDWRIGRVEITEKDTSITLADSSESVAEYIDLLRDYAKNITLDQKERLFYMYQPHLEAALPRQIIRALIQKGEAITILTNSAADWTKMLGSIRDEMARMKFDRHGPRVEKKLAHYQKTLRSIETNLAMFEISPDELGTEFATVYDETQKELPTKSAAPSQK